MKRGAPLQRKTPMRRSQFDGRRETATTAEVMAHHRANYEQRHGITPPTVIVRRSRMAANLAAERPTTVPKDEPLRSETYRRLVASLPCVGCGRAAPSQHCHLNLGKGAGMKTDDRLAWAGCADLPGVLGCHSRLDQHSTDKTVRRRLEARRVLRTINHLLDTKRWPASVPQLSAEQFDMLERWAK